MADMSKPKVLLAPHFRTLQEIFATADLGRLRSVADVEWCRDEPLPPSMLAAHLPDVAVLVGTRRERQAIGRMVADDIELIARGLPPQRMQLAQPELVGRQASVHPDHK